MPPAMLFALPSSKLHILQRAARLACCTLLLSFAASAVDLNGRYPIGPMAAYTASGDGITLTCRDGSEVAIPGPGARSDPRPRLLSRALPARDHSWAIAKTAWDAPKWSVKEEPDDLLIATGRVGGGRPPVAAAGRVSRCQDPSHHQRRRASHDVRSPHPARSPPPRRLGFEEHFYGLGEKAARLDKRRGQFTMWNTDTPGYKEGTDPIYQDIPFYLGWQKRRSLRHFLRQQLTARNFDFGANRRNTQPSPPRAER